MEQADIRALFLEAEKAAGVTLLVCKICHQPKSVDDFNIAVYAKELIDGTIKYYPYFRKECRSCYNTNRVSRSTKNNRLMDHKLIAY